MMQVNGLLFDKDGTLFDFNATWNNWTISVIDHFSEGNATTSQRIADAIDFDLIERAFRPTSPVIAGTNRQAAELVASALPGSDVDAVEDYLAKSATEAPVAPVVPLTPYLTNLQARGLKLGVVTNDTEMGARAHLETASVTRFFDFIAGFDSGFGAKPDPDPLLAFAKAMALDPSTIAMVGDSTHDLIAGRRAGMTTIGVLTGLAQSHELAPYADIVLPHIGHIPELLETA
ncbi:MAG: HAD family hydrolase [Cognatishimia sp.]